MAYYVYYVARSPERRGRIRVDGLWPQWKRIGRDDRVVFLEAFRTSIQADEIEDAAPVREIAPGTVRCPNCSGTLAVLFTDVTLPGEPADVVLLECDACDEAFVMSSQ